MQLTSSSSAQKLGPVCDDGACGRSSDTRCSPRQRMQSPARFTSGYSSVSSQSTCPFCSRNEVLLYSARGLDAPQYTDGVILSHAVHHAAHAPLVAMGSSPATEGHVGSPCGQLRALLGCALDYRRCTRPPLLCRGARAGARNDSVGCAPTAGAPCRLCARPWDASRRGRRGGRRVGWVWVAPCV